VLDNKKDGKGNIRLIKCVGNLIYSHLTNQFLEIKLQKSSWSCSEYNVPINMVPFE
jgi:hypothetical protein